MVVPFYSKDDQSKLEELSLDLLLSDNLVSDHTELYSLLVKKANSIIEYFPRLHSLVIGPGLGRKNLAIAVTKLVIEAAVKANLSLVIDADGLWAMTYYMKIIKGYKNCILTPNSVEFERLRVNILKDFSDKNKNLNSDEKIECQPVPFEMLGLESESIENQVAAVGLALVIYYHLIKLILRLFYFLIFDCK